MHASLFFALARAIAMHAINNYAVLQAPPQNSPFSIQIQSSICHDPCHVEFAGGARPEAPPFISHPRQVLIGVKGGNAGDFPPASAQPGTCHTT